MNDWLGIALAAYLVGAAIEGVDAASQLSRSSPESTNHTDSDASEPANSPQGKWHLVTAIATVSICGSFFWPCRLLHRSFKGIKAWQND